MSGNRDNNAFERPTDQPIRVGYILHRFPHLTETFIVREMEWMRDNGVELSIFSLMPPRSRVVSERSAQLVPLTNYGPKFSWSVGRSQLHYLSRRPLRYLKALGRVIWQTYREPKVMALALALFPRSVQIAHVMEQQSVDHLHANFVWLEGIAAGVARDLIGVSFTLQPHAFGLFSRNQRNVRRELESASRIVTIADFHRRYIAALSPSISADDIDIVHCGVDTDAIRPRADRAGDGPPLIVSVGRAVEKKGHEYLVDACAALTKRGVDYRCEMIVGTGSRADRLQERINAHDIARTVQLRATTDEAGVMDLLSTADVFALACVVAETGDRDGIPVSLMEAMAMEVPAVSTTVSGIPELIDSGTSGLLVAPGDPEALADAIALVLTQPDMAAALAAAGRRKVQREFDIRQTSARMLDVFTTTAAADGRKVAHA